MCLFGDIMDIILYKEKTIMTAISWITMSRLIFQKQTKNVSIFLKKQKTKSTVVKYV